MAAWQFMRNKRQQQDHQPLLTGCPYETSSSHVPLFVNLLLSFAGFSSNALTLPPVNLEILF